MKRLIFILLLAVSALAIHAQTETIPDSTVYTVEAIDTSLVLTAAVYYSDEDGGRSVLTGTTQPMDSVQFTDYIQTLEIYGGAIGQVKIIGKIDKAKAAQRFLIAEAKAKSLDEIGDNFTAITGQDLQEQKTQFDGLFVSYWTLVQRQPSRIETQVEIFRNQNNQRLIARDSLAGGRVFVESRDEISLINVGGLTTRVNFVRRDRDSNVLTSIDGNYILRPDRDKIRAESQAKNK